MAGRNPTPMEEWLVSLIHKPHTPPDPETAPLLAEYPAHLHIDLLPAIQKQGWGRVLMESLLKELRARAAPGVHLGTASQNANAIAFYQRLGFSILGERGMGVLMGLRL
jgi:ribosomal protein S18 acetylase RimI-like enzyme